MQVNQLKSFDFEGTSLRVFGDTINPLFAVSDVCTALGISNPTMAVSKLADFEKTQIDIGQGPAINAVNESGLYTLILRSRDAVKEGTPAYRFRVKVTAEILPAIRKTGRYEYKPETEYLTEEHAYQLMAAVARRAKSVGAHYQTIYRALKARYQVTKYTHIKDADFEDAMRFIQTVPIKTRAEWLKHEEEEIKRIESATYKDEAIPPKYYTVKAHFMEELRSLVYTWRYLHRANLERYVDFLRSVDSPYAASMWEAVHDFNWLSLEASLDKIGYSVKELPCYKHWLSHQPA